MYLLVKGNGEFNTEGEREESRSNTEGMKFESLTGQVIGCAIEVHRAMGPGLLESTYEQCLAYEMSQAGMKFKIQCPKIRTLVCFFLSL